MLLIMGWLALAVLFYIYIGYWLLLRLIITNKFIQNKIKDVLDIDRFPHITVLVTVHNEAEAIQKRIENILDCRYPSDLLDILIASDGSTDETDNLVLAFNDPRVRLFRPEVRNGKSDTQNQAVSDSTGDILVFTDADTMFDQSFLEEIVQPFANQNVGGVDGHLQFVRSQDSCVSQSQGFYWTQELEIREFESQLGILAVTSGACLAVRKKLFRPLIATVGEDCLIPLDIVTQGYKVVHASSAVAFDVMPSESSQEFRTRVRMTLRNWQGSWMYPGLLNPFKNPGISFSLWSHKILRWLSPLFLTIWIFSGLMVLDEPIISSLVGWLAVIFIITATLGVIANLLKWKIPIIGTVYSFCLANAGFLVGVYKALLRHNMTIYKS